MADLLWQNRDPAKLALEHFLDKQGLLGATITPKEEGRLKISFPPYEDNGTETYLPAHEVYKLLAAKGIEPLHVNSLPNTVYETIEGDNGEVTKRASHYFFVNKSSVLEKLPNAPEKGFGIS